MAGAELAERFVQGEDVGGLGQADLCGGFEREALWASIDALNQRHGRRTVQLGSQEGLDLVDLGLKIAFTRIPDRVETKE